AIQEAYRGLLMTGRYAVSFLFLDLPPDQVDVNVHPTKAEVRFRDGHVPELDVQQARSNLAQTRSQVQPLESSLRMANNQLCVLLAMPAQQVADSLEPRPIPEAPAEVAVGIPAELLRRRPDVRQAEREVAAQSEQIGIATADLYPRFALNGFLGYAPTEFGDLFSEKSFFAFVFPTFQWKILNYGRLRNNIQMQQARFQGRVLKYQQTVLQAQREVEDALAAFLRAQEQARDLEESVTATERSVELVLTMYRGGIADFNRVYNTQSLLAAQQDQLAQVRGTIALRLIDVYRALGGGWQYFSHSAACAPLATTSASLPAGRGPLPNSTRLKPAGPSPARSAASSADGAEAIAPLESLPPGSRSDRLPTATE
ncbi:MAG TPA: TolC family protein, partial [Pirellulales bacterium]|nr:TolC family protein [Pirellulales bacterium]